MSRTRWRTRAIPAIQMLSAASALTRAEWMVLLYAWLLFAPFAVLLRFISFKRLAALCFRAPGGTDGLSPARVAQLVAAAARFSPVRPSCLVQALVLQRVIGGQAHEAAVVIGAVRRGESIAAHAWVEAPGQILLGGAAAADYRVILRLPLAAREAGR